MNKRILIIALSILITTGLSAQHRIIMQLSSNDSLVWKGLVNNLKHLKAGWADSVVIEVVAHGPGIDFLVKGKTTQQEKIRQFKEMGIQFIACENTMTERKVARESIIPEAGFVKMGIGEIVRKQEAGWSYIKAGF
jgi:intracellular sulfur oxidation DsrE/DsrF family protein